MSSKYSSRKTSSNKGKRRRTGGGAAAGPRAMSRAEIKSVISTSAEKKYSSVNTAGYTNFSFAAPAVGGLWPLIGTGVNSGNRLGSQIVTDWLDFRLVLAAITGFPNRCRALIVIDRECGNAAAPAAANFFNSSPNWLSCVEPTLFGKGKRFKLLWDKHFSLGTPNLAAAGTAGGYSDQHVHTFRYAPKGGFKTKFMAGAGTALYTDIQTGSVLFLLLTEQIAGGGAPNYQFSCTGQFRDSTA